MIASILSWLLHWLGMDNASGRSYLFWSGFGADIPIFVAVGAFYWRHSCHVHRCMRIGRHPVDGTAYTTCSKHHPTVPDEVTAEHIREQANGA